MTKWRWSAGEDCWHPDLVDYDAHYPALPESLDPFIFGFVEIGPCVMAILERDFQEAFAEGEPQLWELPVPCKLFMELPWRFHEGCVVVDVARVPECDWSLYYEPDLW